MAQKIERERLFEDVWATPMTVLCRRYALSYAGLRKLCAQMGIPIPQRGYWARVAAGHVIEKPALPPLDTSAAPPLAGHALQQPPPEPPPTKTAPESLYPEPQLGPSEEFHPALRPLLATLLEAEREALQWKEEFDRKLAIPPAKKRTVQIDFHHWERFCDSGQMLFCRSSRFVLHASLRSWKRAMVFLQTVATRLEAQGYEIRLTDDMGRLQAVRSRAIVSIRVTEKAGPKNQERIYSWLNSAEWDKWMSSTGNLAIFIGQMGSAETKLADLTNKRLEEQWDPILAAVEHRYQRSLLVLARWEKEQAERDASRLAELEETRRGAEAKRREETEKVKRAALLHEAEDWRSAATLRAYLESLEYRRKAGGSMSDDYEEWRAWARSVAEDLDKSKRHIREEPSAFTSDPDGEDSK